MKKILLLGLAMMALVEAKAQTNQYLSFGPVAGLGGSSVANLNGDSRFMPSGYLGVGAIYSRYVHWGWGAQLVVSSEGYKMQDPAGNIVTADPMYLRLPLRAYYFFGNYNSVVRPKIYLGPSLGLKLSEIDNISNDNGRDLYMTENRNNFRTFDLGVNAGAGVNIKLAKATWLNLDLGYYQGLLDAVKDPAGNYNTNQNLVVSGGVLFGIR